MTARYVAIGRVFAATASTLALAAGFSTAAHAQENAPTATPPAATAPDCPDTNSDGVCDTPDQLSNADQSAQDAGNIVVTGSRIRRDSFSTIEPLTVVTRDEITQSGFNSSTDALQGTAVTAGAGQINNYFGGFVTDGGTGANTLGLRNLGPARTLILLNGRRLSPAGTRGSVLAADLNVLPTAIVERIEVLKAGASSIYGSDAVAGVVNIITDRRLRGISLDAQVNIPENGAGVDRRISASFGFGNENFNLIGSVEYRDRKILRLRDVDFTRCPIEGLLSGEGTAFGSGDFIDPATGQPKCFTVNNGGVTINTIGVPTRQGIGRTSGALGNFNRFVPAPGLGGGATPGYLGVGTYDRDSFDPASQDEALITPVETLTGFVAGTYSLHALGNAELYAEVLATRRNSSAPLYRQLSLDYVQGSPLLPAMFRNGAFLAPNETSSGQIVAARAFIGFGLTNSSQEVDFVRAGGGIRGDFFFPGWKYDAYVGKSWTDGTYEIESFLIDRIAASLQVVQNPDGSFSCASLATNRNCVAAPPLNAATVGGNLPQAYRDYILQNTIGTTKFRESTAVVNFNGPLFRLPGGEVQLAVGAEYRSQRIDDTPDINSQNGNLLGLTASLPTRGTDAVKEVYGELYVPIVSERPFFYALNLDGSVRYTDYDSYGSDTTYKISGEWQFARGIGIRGSYGTSFRAPALAEQFLGATSGFISGANDPCDSDNFPSGSPGEYTPNQQITAANCAAIGINVGTFVQNNGITVFNRGGADTGLSAETSTNWSVGAVLQPRISNRFSFSLAVDYFDIDVENGVAALSAAQILGRCYGANGFNPAEGFCRFVNRDANNVLTVTSGYVNLATDRSKGYELTARLGLEALGGQFTFNANVTHYTEQSNRLFPEEFLLDSNDTAGTPNWVGTFDLSYRSGPALLRYGLTWINASHRDYQYQSFDRELGPDPDLEQLYRENYQFEVPNYFTHTVSAQFRVAENFELTMGVRNIFDTEPPLVSAVVAGVANAPLYSGYDYAGRTFFVNTSIRF